MLAKINLRSGGFYLTAIDTSIHTPETLAQRMTGGGFVICEDERFGRPRILIVNLADVSSIALTPEPNSVDRA